MRTEDLVFWIDVLTVATAVDGGVLCQRHGDSMVVPRGWTLDDLRDPELHLFRPPDRPVETVDTRSIRRRQVRTDDDTEQLELGVLVDAITAPESGVDAGAVPVVPAEVESPATTRTDAAENAAAAADEPEHWTPAFDDADDLDGLLAARSPLLSRAFRGADRPG